MPPAQGLEPSAGTNWGQHNLSTSPEVVVTGTRGGGFRVCTLQVRVTSILSIVPIKLLVGVLKSF